MRTTPPVLRCEGGFYRSWAQCKQLRSGLSSSSQTWLPNGKVLKNNPHIPRKLTAGGPQNDRLENVFTLKMFPIVPVSMLNFKRVYGGQAGHIDPSHLLKPLPNAPNVCICFPTFRGKWTHSRVNVGTPLKTNMSPENQWSEYVVPIEMVPFWGTC